LICNRFTRYEELPGWAIKVCDRYMEVLNQQTMRLFYYQTVISTREARHMPTRLASWWAECETKYTKEFVKFQMGNKGSEGAAMTKFDGAPPNMPFVLFVDALNHCFRKGGFSGSFGGSKWGKVNDNLYRLVTGQVTAEAFVDTAYTLAHNTGPIFNKGYYYHVQLNQQLIKILDLQRAGLIPTFVLSCPDEVAQGYLPDLVKLFCDNMPNHGIEDKIDWQKVQAAGAVGNYSKLASGATPFVPKTKKLVKEPVGVTPVKFPGVPEDAQYVTQVQYYPHEVLTVYKRKSK
jgi:hypothetical protein